MFDSGYEVIGFGLLAWWCVSTYVRNTRWLKAFDIENGGKKTSFLVPLLKVAFFPLLVRREEQRWARRVIEQEERRNSNK
jgi:hypothetical protein